MHSLRPQVLSTFDRIVGRSDPSLASPFFERVSPHAYEVQLLCLPALLPTGNLISVDVTVGCTYYHFLGKGFRNRWSAELYAPARIAYDVNKSITPISAQTWKEKMLDEEKDIERDSFISRAEASRWLIQRSLAVSTLAFMRHPLLHPLEQLAWASE